MPKEHGKDAARFVLIGAFLSATIACSDVGDSSAVPCGVTNSPAAPDSSLDVGPDVGGSDTRIQGQDGSDGTASSADAYAEASQGSDSNDNGSNSTGSNDNGSSSNGSSSGAGGGNGPTEDDAGMVEAPPASTTGTSIPDAGTQGSADEDSSPNGGGNQGEQSDAAVQDAAMDAVEEVTFDAANGVDATLTDSGGGDVASDSGGEDTTVKDASDASREAEVGAAEAGSDSGSSTPCTSAPCGTSAVPCDGNTKHNNVCTPTEALIVARDIAKGNVSSGKLTMNSCYECMLAIGCIDDDQYTSDVNHECGDLSSSGVALDGESYGQACLDTVSCIIDQACDTGNPPSACFCGTASTNTCFVTQGAANGACLNQEISGLPKVSGASCTMGSFASGGTLPTCTVGDLTATDNDYIDGAEPSGMANTLMGCAYSNCQSECTP